MESTAVLRTLEALMDAEPEIAEGFLMAAIYCRAIRTETPPRDVLDAMWKAMPSSDAWPAFRGALESMLEQDDEPGDS